MRRRALLAALAVPALAQAQARPIRLIAGSAPGGSIDAVARVIAQPEVRDKLTGWGLAVQFMTGPQLGQRERAYSAAWAQLIRRIGYQPQ